MCSLKRQAPSLSSRERTTQVKVPAERDKEQRVGASSQSVQCPCVYNVQCDAVVFESQPPFYLVSLTIYSLHL